MLRLKQKITGIKKTSFYDSGSMVFYHRNYEDRSASLTYIWRENELKKINVGFQLDGAVSIGNQVLVTDSDIYQLRLLDAELNVNKKILPGQLCSLPNGIIKCESETYIITDKGDIYNNVHTIYRFSDLKELYSTSHSMRALSNSFIILEKDGLSLTGIVKLYDMNLNLLWKSDLNEHFEAKALRIKQMKGHSLLFTNGAKHSILISFTTGELLWKSEDYLLQYAKPNYDGRSLISFNQGYVEFDLETGERKINRILNEKYPNHNILGSSRFCQSGDMIITIEDRRKKIFFYDIIRDEILYLHEEKEAEPYLLPKPIYYHQGHLFVRDAAYTLFVYEVDQSLVDKLEINIKH